MHTDTSRPLPFVDIPLPLHHKLSLIEMIRAAREAKSLNCRALRSTIKSFCAMEVAARVGVEVAEETERNALAEAAEQSLYRAWQMERARQDERVAQYCDFSITSKLVYQGFASEAMCLIRSMATGRYFTMEKWQLRYRHTAIRYADFMKKYHNAKKLREKFLHLCLCRIRWRIHRQACPKVAGGRTGISGYFGCGTAYGRCRIR